MKHKIISLGLIAAVFAGFSGCSDEDFSSLYPDPSKTSTVSCEKLMTGVFYSALTFTKPTRDGIEYYDLTIYGKYAQTTGYANTGWAPRISGAPDTRWKEYYKMLAQYRTLEDTYAKLDEAGKKDYEVFTLLAEVFVYQQTLQMVDLFGDIPYSGAGMLAITGNAVTSRAKFDKAEDIYSTMLDRLGAINTRIREMSSAGLSTLTSTYLSKQDYICSGNLDSWRRFANSLRLRIATRVALNGSLTAKAQGIIKEMLETNAGNYPVIETNDQNVKLPVDNDGFNPQKDESGSNGILDAYSADGGRNQTASQLLLDCVTGSDPRRPVMFNPNANGEYVGMKYDQNGSWQGSEFDKGIGKVFAVADSATFGWNNKYPGTLFTAAEVGFIKAEACQRGWAGGNAENAFRKAVVQSVDFYFYLNGVSTFSTPVSKPSDADIAAFAESLWSGTSNKMNIIGTQKWVHFSMFQQLEAWNDVRRTGIPALIVQDITDAQAFHVPPSRFIYPENEYLYNRENYPSDAGRTNEEWQRKLFWAKPDGYFTTIPQVIR